MSVSSSASTDVKTIAGRDITQNQTTNIFNSPSKTMSKMLKMSKINDPTKRLDFLRGKLLPAINTSFKDPTKRPCEPDTRLEILKEIYSWAEDISEHSQRLYWLSGEPGVGKSTIAASIAKYCDRHNILGAQFFINHNNDATTSPSTLFQSICWQLCNRFPQVAIAVEKNLRARPTLVDDVSIDDQAEWIFIDAIKAVGSPQKAVVVVIDALDEIDTKRLRNLAKILFGAVADLPRYAKLFISSRAENDITSEFNELCRRIQVKSTYLTTEGSREEVSQFMKKRVKKILEDNGLEWDSWGDERMKKLSSRAAGLYILAETALEFFRAEIEKSGDRHIEGLLEMLAAKDMKNINTLYLTTLRKTCKHDDWEYKCFRRIIGAILVRQTPLSIFDMGGLLDLRDPVCSKTMNPVHFVRQYRTILINHTKEINGLVVPRPHKPFADFVTSGSAREFRVDKTASHRELALRCVDKLTQLVDYWNKKTQLPTSFFTQLVYASQCWQSHLTRMVEPDLNDDVEEKNGHDTFEENDLNGLPTQLLSAKDLKPDAKETRYLFAFSPDGTQIAESSDSHVILWDAKTGSRTKSLVGHKDRAWSVGFSPDGTQLVSGSRDNTAIIWDTRTGRQLQVLSGHTGWVVDALFSHDGNTVATCSRDWTLRTWDISTGQSLKVFKGYKNGVYYCVFSPDDQRIASYSMDHAITVWDVNSGNLITKIQCTFDSRSTIAFCWQGDHIIWHGPEITHVWDSESGKPAGLDDATNSSFAPLEGLMSDSEGSLSLLRVLECSNHSTVRIYSLNTKDGEIRGIVEHGRGVWKYFRKSEPGTYRKNNLRFVTGGTETNHWW